MSKRCLSIILISTILGWLSNSQCFSAIDENKVFSQVIKQLKNKDFLNAINNLNQLIQQNPSNSLYWFNQGNAYYMLGNYVAAINAYQHVSNHSNLFLPAKLYTAKSNIQHGEKANAVAILTELKQQSLPPALEDQVKQELSSIYVGEALLAQKNNNYSKAIHFINLSVDIFPTVDALFIQGILLIKLKKYNDAKYALESANNLNSDTETKRKIENFLLILKGLTKQQVFNHNWINLITEMGYNSNYFETTSIPEDKIFSTVSMSTGFQLIKHKRLFSMLTYSFEWKEVFDLPSEQLMSNYIGLPLKYERSKWILTIEPSYIFQLLERVKYLTKPGIALDYVLKFATDWESKTRLSYVTYTPWSSDFDYATGYYKGVNTGIRYINSNYLFEFYYSLFKEKLNNQTLTNGTLPGSYDAFGPFMNIVWLVSPKFNLEGSASLYNKSYTPAVIPRNEWRKDKQLSVHLTPSYYPTPKTQLFIRMNYIKNDSNLESGDIDNRNYDEKILSAGVNWELI